MRHNLFEQTHLFLLKKCGKILGFFLFQLFFIYPFVITLFVIFGMNPGKMNLFAWVFFTLGTAVSIAEIVTAYKYEKAVGKNFKYIKKGDRFYYKAGVGSEKIHALVEVFDIYSDNTFCSVQIIEIISQGVTSNRRVGVSLHFVDAWCLFYK